MNLWIVTVNFGDTSTTNSLIESLSTIENIDTTIVSIADNATSDKSIFELNQIIEKSKLDIKIFSYKKNLYYWPAVKKVINTMKGMIGSYPDWVIVCNNDITFKDKNFFKVLSKTNKEKYPIIGPNIINSKGFQLNPFMIYPLSRFEKFYWNIYFFSYPLSIIILNIKKLIETYYKKSKAKSITTNQQVYAVHGSAILFSNYFFDKGGWIDDNFEMYGEELTVAEIAKNLNLPITFFPELRIIHHEHKSTRKINRRLLFNKAKKSHRYFQSEYLR